MTEYNFRKGDIIRNLWAGPNNPTAYLVYLRKSSICQGRYGHKTYECLDYKGRKVQLMREDAKMELIGHMEEFDDFVSALESLKDLSENGGEERGR